MVSDVLIRRVFFFLRGSLTQFSCFRAHLSILGYYDGATELYEYGWAKSFHFSRFYKGEGFEQSVRSRSTFFLLWSPV